MSTPESIPRLLKITEAAAYTGRSVWSLREAIWSGDLPFVRGKGYLLDRADLDSWIEKTKKRLL